MPALDGLRALAITLVFVTHEITPVRFGGRVGVGILFVLSDYLTTAILLTENRRSGIIHRGRIEVRRLARPYPSLLLAIGTLFIAGMLFGPSALKCIVEKILAVTYTTPLAMQADCSAAWAWRYTRSLGIEEIDCTLLAAPILVAVAVALAVATSAVLTPRIDLRKQRVTRKPLAQAARA